MQEIRILWADDEIDLLKPHLLFLEGKGCKVDTVNNGLDAIDAADNTQYDLVFLDENMPGISGLDALKSIKEKHTSVPVVMITKSEEEHIMEDAIGSKIEDYLIKPVNPNQIWMSIKKLVDQKRLVSEKTNQRYQQDFQQITMSVMDGPNWEEWKSLYKKLTYWSMELQESGETGGMSEVFDTQFMDANREFCRFISRNYTKFIQYDNKDAPLMSHTVMNKYILNEKEDGVPLFIVVVDNLRYDQWKSIQTLLTDDFRITQDDLYLSILPTTTQYCRNALFSGLMPLDIERQFGNKWSNDEDEGGKNLHEQTFFEDLLRRLRKPYKSSYTKVTQFNFAKDLPQKINNLWDNDVNVIVYNFVDTLSHARTDNKVMRELAEDEKAYRSLTYSWFEHSPLLEALRKIGSLGGKVVLTTDHGSVKVSDTVKIAGDKNTTTNLRYKHGRNLGYNSRDVFELRDPDEGLLPTPHVSSRFVFAYNRDFFVYPNNLNHYAKYYRDTFQHGGISMEEMMVPLAVLYPK
jgi:CheY-like chemotaxis protein